MMRQWFANLKRVERMMVLIHVALWMLSTVGVASAFTCMPKLTTFNRPPLSSKALVLSRVPSRERSLRSVDGSGYLESLSKTKPSKNGSARQPEKVSKRDAMGKGRRAGGNAKNEATRAKTEATAERKTTAIAEADKKAAMKAEKERKRAIEESRLRAEAESKKKAGENIRALSEEKARKTAEDKARAKLEAEKEEKKRRDEEKEKQNDPRNIYEQKIKSRREAVNKARQQPKSPQEEQQLSSRYGSMDPEERAFNILLDLGMIERTPDPTDTDYFDGDDDEACAENIAQV